MNGRKARALRRGLNLGNTTYKRTNVKSVETIHPITGQTLVINTFTMVIDNHDRIQYKARKQLVLTTSEARRKYDDYYKYT